MAKYLTLLAAVLSLIFTALPLSAEEAKPAPDAERLAAARDLMDVTGVTRQLDGMIKAMSDGFAKGAKAQDSAQGKALSDEFDAIMQKFLAYKEEMMADFAALYAANFTAAEMKEVADFYRSGTGAKFISSMPSLMQQGAAIGIKYSQKVHDEMSAGGRK